ncbi:unnamed protein product [Echinostoma caproni]|uniref:RNA (guanine-9-)-methyltransferase domain-containing protein 1 n=1 Tax=Echinostoma caproni TaxID=27848 RepID=A0A183B0S3_9TREM|nr:unnamed protein product [Echinostoma caproni]
MLRRIFTYVLSGRQLIPSVTPRGKVASTIHAHRWVSTHPIVVSPYLLDRTVPAEEILNKLMPSDSERLKFLESEHRLLFDGGQKVPSTLTPKMKLELLCCQSYTSRIRLHEFFFKRQMRRENRAARKAQKSQEEPSDSTPTSDGRIIRVVDPRCNRYHDEAYMWAEIRCPESAQPLVFDFTHESEMRLQDQKNLASQLAYAMQCTRRMRPYPFHLWLCGLKPGSNQYSFMEQEFGVKSLPDIPASALDAPVDNSHILRQTGRRIHRLEDFPWTISPNHYSKDFPLNDPDRPVIYLTPNAHRAFEPGEWDHNAVYVVGAIVDKIIRRPVTFAKARRSGVECIRLPLERYFKWSSGSSKTLTVNCIHAILATAKSTNGDWETALRTNLPRRLYDREEKPRAKLNSLFDKL